MRKYIITLIASSIILCIFNAIHAADTHKKQLKNDTLKLQQDDMTLLIIPATFEMLLESKTISNHLIQLSKPVFFDTLYDTHFNSNKDTLSMRYSKKKVMMLISLKQGNCCVTIIPESNQEFLFPKLCIPKKNSFLIWPHNEGKYIPLDDKKWLAYLKDQQWHTIEELYMPFWGVETEDSLQITYITDNPFYNTVSFTDDIKDVTLNFTHSFYVNTKTTQPITFYFSANKKQSPIEPARKFRRYLASINFLVSLKQKSKVSSNISKLIGAPHAYLWGSSILSKQDIKDSSWITLAKSLLALKNSPYDTKIQHLFTKDDWKNLKEMATMKYPPYVYIKLEVTHLIEKILKSEEFLMSNQRIWDSLPQQVKVLTSVMKLTPSDIAKVNSYIFYERFKSSLNPPSTWGGGCSTKMIDLLSQYGFKKFILINDDYESIPFRTNVAAYAAEKGYLFGTYDDYSSVHDPALKSTDESWGTSQFDKKLFEEGRIIGEDGEPLQGFLGKGYQLSPIAVRPYLESRVRKNFSQVPYTYYFVDGDAYGQYFDDYSSLRGHISQQEDAEARIDRLRWIFNTFKTPIGSEGGQYLFTPVLSIAEGVFLSVFGYADPDMKKRPNSKYFLGWYYPAEEQEIYFKQVPLKQEYFWEYIDPKFRLPLYETVFHDVVITSTHWEFSSQKFTNASTILALTEILYQVPPLYHLNENVFDKVKLSIKKQSDVFDKTHTTTSEYPLQEFEFLTKERDVQKSIFGPCTLIVNYKNIPYTNSSITIPPKSVKYFLPGDSATYTP